jgi:hypothetical protein
MTSIPSDLVILADRRGFKIIIPVCIQRKNNVLPAQNNVLEHVLLAEIMYS